MKTIETRTWRRRIDRTQPEGRGRDWVMSVANGRRHLDADVIRNFERIVQRIQSKKSQHSAS